MREPGRGGRIGAPTALSPRDWTVLGLTGREKGLELPTLLSLVHHAGNTSASSEEVTRITEPVRRLLKPGVRWIDFDGDAHPLTHADLRIVSPYNAQVAALRTGIPEVSEQIGTVDRFQGQEAPVVIYSMTPSSTERPPAVSSSSSV